ncbi:MAG TPA: carboxypeptidase-like regulatory domain-containing protein, partial [Bacteroidia bacterium]|nr:carboxypeptidase-like regulatory domain-containing protein [Bacteroidia bacterium]
MKAVNMGAFIQRISLIIFLAVPFIAGAQNGTIKGRVTDAAIKEGLIGASVQVKGTSIGDAADMEGYYEIKNVQPGTYTLEVRQIGYQTVLLTGVKVGAGETIVKDVELSEQTIEASEVVIIGEKPLVDVETPRPNPVVTNDQISEGTVRQIGAIINTQPGVVSTPSGVFIRGGRTYESGFLIDGVSARDPLAGTGFGIDIGSNALDEIDINTSGSSADVGDATSGVVNVKTRSGGDSLEISVLHKRDNFGFNKDWSSAWNSQVTELSIGGPSKWLFPGNPKRLRYFVSLRNFSTDNFTKNPPNQVVSSLYPNTAWTPYLDNRWSGLLKL